MFASGLIAGEALVGIALAAIIASGVDGVIRLSNPPDWAGSGLRMFSYVIALVHGLAAGHGRAPRLIGAKGQAVAMKCRAGPPVRQHSAGVRPYEL